ncbi:hypothetical protein [Aquitalea sp. LB_tupeE]|uniref:hypothetical protein n=1 Tax=Aquitalea sp. LB_tupeE TaxID=2748078 RepID=UPI0015BCEA4E|nr:hypothetical protein [Aquitalea sp. LB_tupeE]NWK80381.1 hypothetical protein [Aquitalea sp. LB_tupeE]
MLRLLTLFGGFTVGWWSLLWLVLPLSWQRISPSAMLLLHIVPPVALTLGLRWWTARKEKKAEAERQQAEEAAAAERDAARAEARRVHQAALAERQQTIACRWLRCTALPVGEEPAWLDDTDEHCQWLTLDRDELEEDELLAALAAPQREALEALYLAAPGAAWLPVYTEVIPTQSGIEQLAALKAVQHEAATLVLDSTAPAVECRFLPGHGSVAERARQLLLQNADCPGLVVLAADAPVLPLADEDDFDATPDPELAWRGKPGFALACLLFLRQGLPCEDVGKHTPAADTQDPYQPYWEKPQTSQYSADWGPVPPSRQATLAGLPVLAELTQPTQGAAASSRAMQLSRQLQPMLDNALVNAALLDYPFSEEDAQPAANRASSLGWLVHNSGEVQVGGARLSALSGALSRHQVELHPIDQASNSVREWGDTGASTAALLCASAITHCHALAAPVLLAQFGPDEATLSMARPPLEEMSS